MLETAQRTTGVTRVSGATLLAGCLLLVPTHVRGEDAFRIQKLDEGIELYLPTAGTPELTNSLVVEREDGVLVVGAQPSPEAARRLLALIDARTGKPVRYLVYPHSHADAAGGGSAFPDSVLVIGSARCHQALEDPEYDFGAEARLRSDDPSNWVEPPRRPPSLVLTSAAVLDDPRNPVEVLPASPGHSPGDLAVSLSKSDIHFVGAVLFPDRAPYGSQAQVKRWLSTLNHLLRKRPKTLIPLHGPIVDLESARAQRDALSWLQSQITEGIVDRLDGPELRERLVNTEGFDERFDPDSIFLTAFLDEAIAQAFRERDK